MLLYVIMEHLVLYKSPFFKKRIGHSNDGGYVIAILPGEYDRFLSGGIANDITFETGLLDIYPNLVCYAFDGSISELPERNGGRNERIHFVKKNLGNAQTDTVTNMHDYMADYNNIFLKMDIEGHEFRILPTFFENRFIHKIKQLVIEIHSPADIALHPEYFVGLSDIKNADMFWLFQQLNKTHTLIHFHANNGCDITVIDGIRVPHVFQLTYIRNDFILSERVKNCQPLPTELDAPNVVNKPEYSLSGFPYSVINSV